MGKKGENFFYDSNNEKCSSSELHLMERVMGIEPT